MRHRGKSEATIAAVLGAVGRIYKFAVRRLGFTGMNPITLMLSSEPPRDATVTRVVYIHEIADARRRHVRRSRMTAYPGALRVALEDRANDVTP